MIKILCVGKIKEQYLTELISDYQKRINKYHKLDIIEIKDEGIEKEESSLLKLIKPTDYVISLCIEGNTYSSLEFASLLDNTFQTNSNIVFVIGGSDGLGEQIKSRSNLKLSFSKLTFPHGLFRGILLEQIYRAFKINNNETYHK